MANVYSTVFYKGPVSNGTSLGGPPSGSVWVLRELVAWVIDSGQWRPEYSPAVCDDQHQIYWFPPVGEMGTNRPQEWRGRTVVDNPRVLHWWQFPSEGNWSIVLSGYQLTLP